MCRIHVNVFAVTISMLLGATVSLKAQITQASSVLDGSGTRSSGGSFTNISAAGQPGGITVSSGGTFVNQAGFLNTFLLRPNLDTDGDGLADELDQDNDNDQLADATEIVGGAFMPASATLVNVADTDGDGQLDGWEAVAGTDPNNINALLELVAISNAPGGRGIAWLARGNNEKTYIVRASPDPLDSYSAIIFSNTVAGGVAPWYAVTTSIAHATASNVQFYVVEVRP